MLTVTDNPARVERQLVDGLLVCPDCEGQLRPWGHARRRLLRTRTGVRRIRPRRSRCRQCGSTHVLLPSVMLARRADAVEVIGAALVANAHGQRGHRPIAEQVGRPADTVRGWLRRFRQRAEATTKHAMRCAYRFDTRWERPDTAARTTTATQTALVALAFAVQAVEDFLGSSSEDRWSLVSLLCSGRLLANTNCPYPVLR